MEEYIQKSTVNSTDSNLKLVLNEMTLFIKRELNIDLTFFPMEVAKCWLLMHCIRDVTKLESILSNKTNLNYLHLTFRKDKNKMKKFIDSWNPSLVLNKKGWDDLLINSEYLNISFSSFEHSIMDGFITQDGIMAFIETNFSTCFSAFNMEFKQHLNSKISIEDENQFDKQFENVPKSEDDIIIQMEEKKFDYKLSMALFLLKLLNNVHISGGTMFADDMRLWGACYNKNFSKFKTELCNKYDTLLDKLIYLFCFSSIV